MVIVYQSKTGFTKRYADMLAAKTGLNVFSTRELAKVPREEEIIFLGWLKAGSIQGLNKLRKHNVKAVCASGTGQKAEPDAQSMINRNKIQNIPFFYLRGGCLPLSQIKGMDKWMLSMFLKMLENKKEKDEKTKEAIAHIKNGFDGVDETYLAPVLEWLSAR